MAETEKKIKKEEETLRVARVLLPQITRIRRVKKFVVGRGHFGVQHEEQLTTTPSCLDEASA